jgi:ankyrin repeat protein
MSPERSISPQFWQFKLWQVFALVAVLGVLAAVIAPRLYQASQQWQEERKVAEAGAVAGSLRKAIVDGDAEGVRKALAAGALLSSIRLDDGSSALLGAVTRGHCETVELLLAQGEDFEQIGVYNRQPGIRSATGRGPALFAAVDCDLPVEKKVKMFRLLLAQGANIRREIDGVDLMDVAVRRGDADVGDLLRAEGLPYGPREMAAFNRIDELQQAIRESPDIVHERFESVGRNSTIDDRRVTTLLGIALWKNYLEMARMLLEAGAPVDTREHDGRTPLHIAATLGGDPEAIRLLVKHGSDVNAVDNNGRTPLATLQHWAKREAAKAALLEAGAK